MKDPKEQADPVSNPEVAKRQPGQSGTESENLTREEQSRREREGQQGNPKDQPEQR